MSNTSSTILTDTSLSDTACKDYRVYLVLVWVGKSIHKAFIHNTVKAYLRSLIGFVRWFEQSREEDFTAKGVLRVAWQFDLIYTYHRVLDIRAARGESLPKGRAVTLGELRALLEALVVN